ncbi:hypothetical protein [Streptomyces sp. H27-D2]|uniref:hypothetical protein n=1 Tax=Streptomyces sp. H27-D2 TaxID=3046304 RepID=UPI002DB59E36|nr:hypothetical protein [Streptomyces sp. H27-D2]MEC4019570.1 hypothetical protein [Streptomyces sp. H27-D2]
MALNAPGPRRLPAIALLCTLVLSGCAGNAPSESPRNARNSVRHSESGEHAGHTGGTHSGKPATGTASIEEIADAIGCTPDITAGSQELRQGACKNRRGEYRMVTFAAEKGQHAWLTEAQMYGGTYLVGKRWVVTARKEKSLRTLRTSLGGSLEKGAVHGGH